MALTSVDKMKIIKYLREHAVDDIYYLDLCDALCKRGKIEDIEFLQFFTESIAKEFRKDEKLSMKQLTKMVLISDNFLHWMHQESSEVDEKTLDIIRSFEKLYDEYLNRTNYDIDLDFTDNVIGKILKTVNSLYPSKIDVNDSSAKFINQIAELEEKVQQLTRELEEAKKCYGILEESNKKATVKLSESKQKVSVLRDKTKLRDKEIESLNKTIKSLEEKIAKLDSLLIEKNKQIDFLSPFKEKIEDMSNEVLRLKQIIDNDLKEQEELDKRNLQDLEMEAFIYQQLLFEGVKINDLLRDLETNGFLTNKEHVYALLQRIKSKINVTTNSFSLSPSYKITSPIVMQDGEFKIDIPAGCKHYDIMLVSDFHIKDIDIKILSGFDILNNYCINNGINLILNLGDFFQGTAGHTFEYENAIANHKVVEKSISLIPKAEGIYHAVLGGNHDKNTIKYGFDPISMLCDSREDFINLGYNHSTIALNGFFNPLGRFDIHHPDTFDFPIALTNEGFNFDDLDDYLKDIYNKQGRVREDSYIDIFGHTHKSQFNFPGGYCYLPSYFEGRTKRGACHLRIYFDEESDIKYMVFMPLSFNEKLIKNNELIYQKKVN